MASLEIAVFLALCAKSLADGIVEPIRLKFPSLDLWWMTYVEWMLGGLLSYLAGLNLFASILPTLAGQLLTAIVVGGGAKLIYKLFNR